MPFEHQVCVGIRKIGSEVAITAIHNWFVVAEPGCLLVPVISAIVSRELRWLTLESVTAGPAVLVYRTSYANAKCVEAV